MASKDYPTDSSDAEWAILEPLLPPPAWTGRPWTRDLRTVIDAILYMLRAGCAWRMLRNDLPPWPTDYYYFRKWRDDGTRERLLHELRHRERMHQGREPEATGAIIDSQSVKTTEKGGHEATTVPSA